MQHNINVIITSKSATVNYDGETHVVNCSDSAYQKIITAIKEGRKADVPNIINVAKRVSQYSKGLFTVKDGVLLVDGEEVNGTVAKRILDFEAQGLPCEPLVKFYKKLKLNPSFRAVNSLYDFLETNDHPITDDGNFIAYKAIRSDWLDKHSASFDNSIGNVVQMPRNQVNEDPEQTCSAGLHVASYSYAHGSFAGDGDIIVEVEVDPQDVVAIPVDYNSQKMRTCRYKVIGVSQGPDMSLYRKTNVEPEPQVEQEVDHDKIASEMTVDDCEMCLGYLDAPDAGEVEHWYVCEYCYYNNLNDDERSISTIIPEVDEDEHESCHHCGTCLY